MKLISWNVNGIRSVAGKGFHDWFEAAGADLVCLQEIKAHPQQLDESLLHPGGYHSFWHPAQKAGYSGLVVYSKKEPLSVREGIGESEIDSEGRVLILEFPKFHLINTYFPNSQRDHARLPYKLKFCRLMFDYLQDLRGNGKNVLICGDFNIAHKDIDLKNPRSNRKNAGFLPEERAWMDEFTANGWVDTFRRFEPGGDHYTWWSFRPGVRDKNIGWRLDYFFANVEFAEALKSARHETQTLGSDHCPVVLTLL